MRNYHRTERKKEKRERRERNERKKRSKKKKVKKESKENKRKERKVVWKDLSTIHTLSKELYVKVDKILVYYIKITILLYI